MGRRTLDIDCGKLQEIINEEQVNWVGGRSKFLIHVADIYNKQVVPPEDPVTVPTITLRSNQKKITYTVKPIDKKSRLPSPEQREKTVKVKSLIKPEIIENIRKYFQGNKKGLKFVDDYVKNPTMKNAIKVNCMICMGGSSREIAKCSTKICIFHNRRPFK